MRPKPLSISSHPCWPNWNDNWWPLIPRTHWRNPWSYQASWMHERHVPATLKGINGAWHREESSTYRCHHKGKQTPRMALFCNRAWFEEKEGLCNPKNERRHQAALRILWSLYMYLVRTSRLSWMIYLQHNQGLCNQRGSWMELESWRRVAHPYMWPS